jgi:hypothetical protein
LLHHPSGAQNFEEASKFLKNLWTPEDGNTKPTHLADKISAYLQQLLLQLLLPMKSQNRLASSLSYNIPLLFSAHGLHHQAFSLENVSLY